MPTAQHAHRRARLGHAWWRPAAYSAAAAAAVAALFNPLPALADPTGGQGGGVPGSVPDVGTRPIPAGAVVLPGQSSATTTTPITTSALGGATNPILQKIQKGRDEIATLGDQLIEIGEDRTSAQTQQTSTQQQATQAENDLRTAEGTYDNAASQDMVEAAEMPPGAFDGNLLGLDDLAHLQRGQGTSTEAAYRQLEQAQIAAQIALDLQSEAVTNYTALDAKYRKLDAEINKKQAAQQKLENANKGLLDAAEASQSATDSQLGSQYLSGSQAGQGADPRAIQALHYALAERGAPYVWSTEGPNTFDCSGLMYWSYRKVGFNLTRVSRDQYWQTRNKVVDRYSLLPGDLLFFSYTNSWTGIHHVAMYAGDGMMVEAPRTGLNVRLVPVRWSELFQATRVFGSVQGGSQAVDLGSPDPQPTETTPAHSSKPSHSASPSTSPSHSASPSGSPSTSPSHSASPSGSPSTSPSGSASPSTSAAPTSTSPSPTTDPPGASSPSVGATSPSSTGDGSTSSSTSASSSKSAAVSKSASESASSSAGAK